MLSVGMGADRSKFMVAHLKDNSVLRIGTDDAENLAEFLRSKVQP